MGTEKKLLQLVDEAQRLERLLIENEGELTEALETAMAELETDFEEKADQYKFIKDRFKAQADFFKAKAKEYQRIQKAYEAADSRLSDFLKYAMTELNKTEISGEESRFVLSDTKPRLVIEDESKIPSAYIQETIIKEPKKSDIKADLEMGIAIPGCKLEGGKQLRSYATSPKQITSKKKKGA